MRKIFSGLLGVNWINDRQKQGRYYEEMKVFLHGVSLTL